MIVSTHNKRKNLAAGALAFFIGIALTPSPAAASTPRLGSFWIVDADTDFTWGRLPFDDLIDLDHTPDPLNIRVDPDGPVGSVVFTLDGEFVRAENKAPYAIGGDSNGDYGNFELPTGFHIIEATPYSGADGTGDAGQTSIVTIEVGRSDFDVDSLFDSHDANPGDGECLDFRKTCSLRAAIEESNELDGRQWVHVPQGNYQLELGTVHVTDRVTVIGAAGGGSTVDGNGGRAFRIESLRTDFKGISIVGAHGNGGGGAFIVENGAELKLLDVQMIGNTASGGPGAAIFNAGTTSLRRSLLSDNDANFTDGLCGGGQTSSGGAIGNNSTGKLRIYQSSFINNRAVRGGALINSGFASISNSTFSGNLARAGGGAILNRTVQEGAGRLHVAFSTITKNEANVPCSGNGSDSEERRVGGGLYNLGIATVGSTIIADNTDHRILDVHSHYSPDCWSGVSGDSIGKLTSAGRNVWGELNDMCNLRYPNDFAYDDCESAEISPASCAIQPGDKIRRDKWGTPDFPLDAGLANLQGFPIETHSLTASSPAVDFGGSLPLEFVFLACPDTDQVHAVRPIEGQGLCDAGARERRQR